MCSNNIQQPSRAGLAEVMGRALFVVTFPLPVDDTALGRAEQKRASYLQNAKSHILK